MPEPILAANPPIACNDAHTPQIVAGRAESLLYEVDGKRIIDGLDLTIARGVTTVLMGPNGAGKSVLIRLLHGLLSPTSGRIIWGGSRISTTTRQHQAMVFQRPVLLRRSVQANLNFVLKTRHERNTGLVQEWLHRIGLEQRAHQPARLLSGGEQQRLALARALILAPQVLFLDEPTASLDPASTRSIENLIEETQNSGTTVVLVTHDIGQARRLAHHVAFLYRGKILDLSPAESFFQSPGSTQAKDFVAGRLVV